MRRDRILGAVFAVIVVSAVQSAGCSKGGGGNGGTETPTPSPSPSATPSLTSITPDTAMAGATVVLAGAGLGSSPAGNQVLFGSAPATNVVAWSASSITVTVPPESPAGLTTVEVVVGGVHSNTLPFTMPLPRALYVALAENFTNYPHYLAAFAVATNGTLTALPGSPYAAGVVAVPFSGESNSVKVNLHAKRVFSTSKTNLLAWDIDPFTGALSTAPGSPLLLSTTAFNWGLDVSHDGDRVFVVDEQNASVRVVASTPTGLSLLPGSPFPASRTTLDVPKLTPDGRRLYVNSEQSGPFSVVAFAVASDGTLSELAGSPYALPNYGLDVEMHPSGAFFYHGTFNDGAVTRMDINATSGALTIGPQITASVAAGLACTKDGQRLYVQRYGSGDIYGFTVGSSGALTPMTGSPFAGPAQLGATVEVDASGRWLFMPEKTAAGIRVYSLTTAGAPVEIVGSPFVLDTNGLGASAIDLTF